MRTAPSSVSRKPDSISSTVTISESYEGVEGRTITISGGAINVTAGDDGLNAAGGSDQSGAESFFGGNPFESDASGNVLLTWEADKAFESVLVSTPDVQQGGTYTLTAGTSTQTVEMTSAVYGGGMGMGGMGQMGGQMMGQPSQMGQPGQMGQGGQPGQMGGGRPGGGMGRP